MNQNKTIWIINQYASTPETGMGGRHYYLAQELAQKGYQVYVIAASYTHILKNAKSFDEEFCLENIQKGFDFLWIKVPHYVSSRDKQRILNWIYFSWKVLKLPKMLGVKPDVILYSSLSLFGYLSAERLSKKYQIPLVFEVRDIWPLTLIEIGGYSPSHPFIRLLQSVEDRAYRNADKVISNLKYAVEHMSSRGLDEKKFTWVPNGYSAREILQPIELPQETSVLIPKNKFIIGYTGSIGIANCLQNFIDAAELLKQNEKIHFVIVGHGEYKEQLMKYAQQMGLNNVTFVSPIPKRQIPSMLALFDVCYIGLTKDPLFRFGVAPNKLADYFIAKKPIIYAIDSGKYTPVLDAKAGYQVPPENSQELANAIEKMFNLSPVERKEMGENGYEYVVQNHEYGYLANKLEQVLFS